MHKVGISIDYIITLQKVSCIKEIQNDLVRKMTARLLELVTTDPSVKQWCGKEILHTLNVCMIDTDKNTRQELISQNMFCL